MGTTAPRASTTSAMKNLTTTTPKHSPTTTTAMKNVTTTTTATRNVTTTPPKKDICSPNDGYDCDAGKNIGQQKQVDSAEACCEYCKSTKGCHAWSWNKPDSGMPKYC